MAAEGYGYGKVIMFNEHFVVHGIPAIASAIGMQTTATIEPLEAVPDNDKGYILEDNRLETPGYKSEKLAQQQDSMNYLIEAAGVDLPNNPVKIILAGDLVAASGIGASAASCAAIARALSTHFTLNFSHEKVNAVAYEGEKGYHGTPSGIDNTAATYGSLIWFKKASVKGAPNIMERLSLEKPVEIVIGNTGLVANTSEAVAGVRTRRENEPEKYAKIFGGAKELAFEARNALDSYELEKVGELMDLNHKLLQDIEVSCKELDLMVDIARENGALGAKLTGGGLGGNMVALTPGDELQETVAKAMEKEGFSVLRTKIGV
ncbi:MAG: mevalonate kinase [Thermoplasmata archaeon]|nr:mevalonate kinase [Thermoplasmata archaeon]